MYVFGGYQFLVTDPARSPTTFPATSGGGRLFYLDPNEQADFKTIREFNYYSASGIPGNEQGDLLSVTEGEDGELYAMFAGGDIKRIAPPPHPGDYNDDHVVDAADYVVWRNNVNTTNRLPNDLIGGTIGADHYDQWKSNFGATNLQPVGTAGLAAPEPSPVGLAASSILATLACARSLGFRSQRQNLHRQPKTFALRLQMLFHEV
jgi:hypothetical protein